MEQQRNENSKDLQKQEIRNVVDILDRFFECRLAVDGFRIREHMHEKEKPQRDDARQLVQLSQ
jgi:hypothetical protein